MTETDFWLSLEFRLCGEFMGMPTKQLRRYWCDGIYPTQYLLDGPAPRITGRLWLCEGQRRQEEWDFTLLLPHPVASREEINWAVLLPPDNVTRWLSLDRQRKSIEMEPAVAVPDLPPAAARDEG